jgi:aerobic carbon-monoxide dehydrogenase large subunit
VFVFVGECVALVVAGTREAAYDALELIDVAYEALPAVIDEEAAIAEGASQLHKNVPSNITTYFKTGGDYAAAAPQADQVLRLRLVKQPAPSDLPRNPCHSCGTRYRWRGDDLSAGPGAAHAPALDRQDGRYSGTSVARGCAGHRRRFRAKMHLYPEELLCAWLARELKSLVKWRESRSESHQATSHGQAPLLQ